MSRTKKGAGEKAVSQEVKSLNKEIRSLDKKARDLLRNAGKDIRQVRHEVSELKKVGLVSSRIDARKYIPSRYMLTKLRKNADVLRGEVAVVKAKPSVRKQYLEKGLFEQRGATLIVPKDFADQRTRISRGLIEITRPLRMGEQVWIVLPYKPVDLESLAHDLKDDPTMGGLKRPDELFGFTLFGHNMASIGFPDAAELADYILTRYQHLFTGKNAGEGIKHFKLFRFKSKDSQLKDTPKEGKIYTPRRKRAEHVDWYRARKMERDAARKKKAREKETPEQRKNRLDKQRIKSAQNRQRKWDDN